MGSILSPTGTSHPLSARSVLGRAPSCGIVGEDARVSGEHLVLTWSGERWLVRDLGSSNGTWVNNVRLGAGEKVPITTQDRLAIGSPEQVWVLEDAAAPGAWAQSESGVRIQARGGVLLLPNPQDPELALVLSAQGWRLDDAEDSIQDGAKLQAGGQSWTLRVPHHVAPTVDARAAPALHFRISQDEEFCEISVQKGSQILSNPPRSFNYMLLTLARLRQKDHDLAPESQGWVHQEDLADMLRVEPTTINVQVHRARQSLGQLHPGLGAELVERRARTRQLRLGVSQFQIERMGQVS